MLRIFGHFVPVPAIVLGVFEILLLSLTLYLVTASVHAEQLWQFPPAKVPAQFSVGLSVVALVAMSSVGLYNYDAFLDSRAMVIKILMALLLVAPATAIAALLFSPAFRGAEAAAWPLWFLKATLAWMLCLLITRTAFLGFSDSDLFRRRVVIIGTGRRAARIAELAQRRKNRYFIPKAFVHACSDLPLVSGVPLDLDRTEDEYALAHYARAIGVKEVVVATDDRRGMPTVQLLHCKIAGINVVDYLSFWERENSKIDIEALQPSWLIYSDGFRQGIVVDAIKRVFDIAVGLLLLLLTLPLIILGALAVKLDSPGPLLYCQERTGRNGRPFTLLKFRSMQQDAERDGAPRWAQNSDPRVTRVGALIRRFRVDELPQLWNVLRGDMSFVGPRPERPYFVDQLAQSLPFYRERHSVKPGITGWAQVNYPYGASLDDARQKLAYDLYYVKNRTIFLDLVILIQTVRVILFGEGAR
jgi:sugar transferase (PEP-CTERM system associated)